MSVITVTERAPREGGKFEVSVRFEDGGEHLVGVADPFAGKPQGERLLAWYFEEHLRYPFLDRDREREAVELLGDYGRQLFAQLFEAAPKCAHEYWSARDAGLDGVQLHVVGGVDFHRLHWESLRDEGVGAPFGARVPIIRKVANIAAGFDVDPPSETLRVLVVTARPGGARDVGYRTISRPLLAGLRQALVPVSVELVRPGTWQALKRHLQTVQSSHGSGWYGVVHFDVHGAVASGDELARTRAEGYLLAGGGAADGDRGDAFLFFESAEAGKSDPVPTAEVAGLLVEHRIPVAVMNACQSAMPSGQSEASLAQRLVEAGVPVALGMAYSVTVTAAELMMPTIYKELSGGAELLSAIHAGRRRLFDERGRRAYFDQDLDLEDWVLPVVFSQRNVQLQPLPATPQQLTEIYDRKAWQVQEPEPTYGFVGRDLEVQAIERRLLEDGAHNELLIRGMAGAGKSTLLAHLGWWWQTTGLVERVFHFSYEDRAWTAEQIQQKIIAGLLDGSEQAITESLLDDARLERVADMLRANRHLLVLDNAESITASPASIPHSLPDKEQDRLARFLSRLRGGKTFVLIGSRESESWLAPNAFSSNTYQLGGLDSQAASVLLDRIITRHNGQLPDDEAERDALEELVGLLGGYPLALTVVLPAVTSTAPSAVLAELEQGGEGADPEQLIQRAVEFSHGRLDPTTQNSLVVLAPFTGVVPIGALDIYGQLLQQHEAVRALGDLDVRGALNQAINVGLATPDTVYKGHIRLQPLFPYFLRTRLVDQDQLATALARAHHDLYQQLGPELHALLVSRDPDERAAGVALTRAEYANLTASFDHALANAHPIISFLGPLEEFLDQAHQQHARRCLLEQTIEVAGQPSPVDRRTELAILHNLAGNTALSDHRLDDSRCHHEAELALRQDLGDRRNAAVAYHQLGLVAEEQRRFEEAEAHYEKALEIKLEFNDRRNAASTYHQLGRVAQEQRRFGEAEAHYEKALEIKLEFNDRHNAASTYHQLGRVAEEQRRFEEAEAHYEKALQIELEFNDWQNAAKTYHQLGTVAQEQRRFGEAEAHYKKALEIKLEFNHRHSAASTYHQLGTVVQGQRRFGEAEAHYEKALEIELEFNDRHNSAKTYHQLGRVAQEQRRFGEAEAHYKTALEIELEFNDRHGAAQTQSQLGILLTQTDRIREAIPLSLLALFGKLSRTNAWSTRDLTFLERQRDLIGAETFRAEVIKHSDERVYDKLVSLFGEVEERSRE